VEAAQQIISGRYELTARIGAGGMGEVYEGYDNRLDRKVAVKLMHFPAGANTQDEWTRRFRHEARIMAKLSHPGTPTIHDIDVLPGTPARPYIVMEFIEGVGLDVLSRRYGPLPIGWVAAIGAQTAAVLAAAHQRGIFHRDLKPSNLMLCTEGTVKVLDFGLAMFLDPALSRLTHSGTMLGTPEYMAPEQIRTATALPQTDLYALGLVLHELLTGRRVVEGATEYTILERQVNEPAPQLRHVRPDSPSELGDLIMSMLAKSPEDRPRDAAAVHGAMLPYVVDLVPFAEIAEPTGPLRMYARALGSVATSQSPAPTSGPGQDRELGTQRNDLDFSRGDMARAVEEAGRLADDSRYEQAIEVLSRVVSVATRQLGSRDEEVLGARLRLAGIRFESNDYRGAAPLYAALVQDMAAEYGPYDDRVFACRRQEATCYVLMGDTSGGLELLKHLLADGQRRYGPDDPWIRELRDQITLLERSVSRIHT
jgi:hypothetical protein